MVVTLCRTAIKTIVDVSVDVLLPDCLHFHSPQHVLVASSVIQNRTPRPSASGDVLTDFVRRCLKHECSTTYGASLSLQPSYLFCIPKPIGVSWGLSKYRSTIFAWGIFVFKLLPLATSRSG